VTSLDCVILELSFSFSRVKSHIKDVFKKSEPTTVIMENTKTKNKICMACEDMAQGETACKMSID
jgi:hypothetical protein